MEERVTIISPDRTGSITHTLSEIWTHRELLYFLVWKEIKVRYKQTAIGAAWAVLQPLIAMVIFWFIAIALDLQSGDIPYPLFAYAGLVIWTYFSTALNQSSGSLIANTHLLTKVYFPRALVPLAICLTGLLDYAFASVVLVLLMLLFGILPSLWFPLILIPLLISVLLASGLGLWLSSVSAKYRDVRYIVPFFVQMLFFVTPIIYPPSYLSGGLSWIGAINPLAAIVTSQRAFVLGTGLVDWSGLGVAALVSGLVFLGGLWYFSRFERTLADVI